MGGGERLRRVSPSAPSSVLLHDQYPLHEEPYDRSPQPGSQRNRPDGSTEREIRISSQKPSKEASPGRKAQGVWVPSSWIWALVGSTSTVMSGIGKVKSGYFRTAFCR